MRRPVVIVGDSDSASCGITAGISGRAGTTVEPGSSSGFEGAGVTRVGAVEVGAAPGRGATGGGAPGEERTRRTLLSERPAVEPTAE